MTGRRLYSILLVVLLALNTLSGISKVMAFRQSFRGGTAMGEGDPDLAYSSLKAATTWQPGDASNYLQMGRLVGQAQGSLLLLEELKGRGPAEKLGVGLSVMARGIALNPIDASGWFYLANLYRGFRLARVREERMRLALEAAASENSEKVAELMVGAGEEAGLDPEDRIAVAATLKAIELEPSFHRYHESLADLYWERKLKEEAAREIRDSFALMPDLAAHISLEDDLLHGLADAILEGIERAKSNPHLPREKAPLARARLLVKLQRLPEAIAAYEELRGLDDQALEAECDLEIGKLLQRQGRYRESIAFLDRVIEAGPETVWGITTLYYLGQAHLRLEDNEKAAAYLREYIAKRPDGKSGYLALADALEKLGRSEDAERLYAAAVRKFPDDRATHLRAIWYLRRHGKLEEALTYAEALRRIDPDDEGTETLIQQLTKSGAGE